MSSDDIQNSRPILEPGTQLGKYKLEAVIGRGGFATVYRALQQGPAGYSRPVAVKILHGSGQLGTGALDLFAREAGIVANLRHRNIVQVYDFVREGDVHFLVIELVEGVTARELVRSQDLVLPPWLGVGIGLEICRGLQYAHRWSDPASLQRGIIHRDVKPSNILVDRNGEVKLADFGLAQMDAVYAVTMELDPSKLSESPFLIKGTPAYMSPEQRAGAALTVKTDIFSLARVIRELVVGMESAAQETGGALWSPIRSLSSSRPGIPPVLEKLLDRALAQEAADRPSADEFADGLEAVLRELLPADQSLSKLSAELARHVGQVLPGDGPDDQSTRVLDSASREGFSPYAVAPAEGEGTQKTVPLGKPSGASGDDTVTLDRVPAQRQSGEQAATIPLPPRPPGTTDDPLDAMKTQVLDTSRAKRPPGPSADSPGSPPRPVPRPRPNPGLRGHPLDPLDDARTNDFVLKEPSAAAGPQSTRRRLGRNGWLGLVAIASLLVAVVAFFWVTEEPEAGPGQVSVVGGSPDRAGGRRLTSAPSDATASGTGVATRPLADSRSGSIHAASDSPDAGGIGKPAPDLSGALGAVARGGVGTEPSGPGGRPGGKMRHRTTRAGTNRAGTKKPRRLTREGRGGHPAASEGSGFLSVNSEPWAHVFVDGKAIGTTPIYRHQLTVGAHQVKLVTKGGGSLKRRVRIRSDQHLNMGMLPIK